MSTFKKRLIVEQSQRNRPFAAFHSRGTKPPCWDAKVALGQDQQRAYMILHGNFLQLFLCLSCSSATFTFQYAVLYNVNGNLQRAHCMGKCDREKNH